MQIDVSKVLDKNGNPSRKKKESFLTEEQKHYLSTIHKDANASLYCLKESISPPICVCGNVCAFRNFKQGFGVTCSKACASKLGSQSMKDKFSAISVEEKERIQQKRKRSVREAYGVDHILQNKQVISNLKENRKQKDYEQTKTTIRKYFPSEEIDSVDFWKQLCSENQSVKKLADKYSIQFSYIYRWWEKIGFESPFQRQSSGAEREIKQFVESLGFSVESNNRTILNGKEIDVYVPEKKFGIELDGLYWHRGCSSREKQVMARNQNVDLICVFEDEWEEKQEIVKSIIRSKLGASSNKIFARKCYKMEVEGTVAREFLEKNHLQGYSIAKKHIGLFFGGELVCIASMGRSRFEKDANELIRFCTKLDTTVVGAISKLLAGNKLVSYADRRYSPNGSAYGKVGSLVGETGNGYFWVYKNRRLSRFQTQKSKLENLLKSYDPELSESKNMEANGAYKIYDCGNWKYEIDLE